jgi:predicted nucleotidyltransferase
MKTSAPTLSPLLRSDAQGLLLADLFLDPTEEHSLTQMAKTAGTAVPTAMREVDRLVEAGFALDRRVGATRLVRANANHPMFGAVRELALYAYGPVAVLTPLITKVKGVEKAYIYGSWAARVQGEPGADPGDIDVLLVSNLNSFDAYEIGKEASEVMKREVNVQNISKEAWDSAESGFVKTLKSRPIIELKLAN